MTRRSPIAITALVIALATATAPAADDRSRTDPTGWYWYYAQTPESLWGIVQQTGARIIDIEVESVAPLTFTAALVANQGPHAEVWWYYFDATADDVGQLIHQNGARLIDVEPYESAGQLRFAAVMVANSGAGATGWWWYYHQSSKAVIDLALANQARVIDLDRYVLGKETYYSAVMVDNTGNDASAWWLYTGLGESEVAAKSDELDARVYDLEPYFVGEHQRFDVVFLHNAGERRIKSWWRASLDEAAFWSVVAQHGARPVDIEPFLAGGQRRFSAIFLDNANAMTSRLGSLLDYGADGATGAYVKQVGGPVLAWLQADRAFEPASTIKALIHVHALREVARGAASLDEQIPWCATSSSTASPRDGCPVAPCAQTIELREALRQMMWVSDNRTTDAVVRRFGRDEINATGRALGLSATQLNHPIGCAGEAAASPNTLSVADIGSLYEQVALGLLDEPMRDQFYSLMAGRGDEPGATIDFTGQWGALKLIIAEEGTLLGLPAPVVQNFTDRVRLANKAGGYQLWNSSLGRWDFFASLGGWAYLPTCDAGRPSGREYVFGFFVDHAANVGSRFVDVRGELLREPVREALGTFTGLCGPGAREFVRGDANRDRVLDIADAIFVLSYLFSGGARVECQDAADVNDDGSLDISDGTALLNFLFLGGRLPAGTTPGKPQEDATADQLGCKEYPLP